MTPEAQEASVTSTETTPPAGHLDLPDYARSTRLRALADACGAGMTAAGAGQGDAAGQGDGDGESESEGEGGEAAKPRTFTAVLADLDPEVAAVITGEMSKKNGEARAQRLRAKAAEGKLAEQGAGNDGAGAGGQNDQQNGQQNGQNGADTSREDRRREAEKLNRARARVAESKVEAAASAAGFADPDDAVKLLGDLDSYVDDEFTVDADAIRGDVEDLLTKKPHLKAQSAEQGGKGPRRPAPDRSQGSSASGSGAQRSGTVDAGADLYRKRHARRDAAAASTT